MPLPPSVNSGSGCAETRRKGIGSQHIRTVHDLGNTNTTALACGGERAIKVSLICWRRSQRTICAGSFLD